MNKITLKLVSESFKIHKLKINKLEINNNLKDYWINFGANSVASFKRVLIRFNLTHKNKKKTYYLILNNAFMFHVNGVVELRYSDSLLNFYKYSKKIENYKEIKEEFKLLKSELDLLNAMKKNNLNPTISAESIYKERKLFKLEAIVNFNLVKGEEWKIDED